MGHFMYVVPAQSRAAGCPNHSAAAGAIPSPSEALAASRPPSAGIAGVLTVNPAERVLYLRDPRAR
jgi:hypothetical protein